MTDPDLDAALRAMFRTRAGDIGTVPADLVHLDRGTGDTGRADPVLGLDAVPVLAAGAHRRRQPWLLAAAVAAVLVVAGGVAALALHHGGTDRRNPARPVTTPVTTPTTTSATKGARTGPTTCPATLPPAWRSAFTTAPGGQPGPGDLPLAVSPGGSVLVSRDLGTGHEVDVVGQNRPVVTVPDSTQLAPQYAAFSGDTAVIGLFWAPRGANGADPALLEIDVVQLSTRTPVHRIEVATPADYRAGTRTSNGLAVVDGTVYWDQRPSVSSRTAVVRSYVLATGTAGPTVADPVPLTVTGSAGGLYGATFGGGDTSPIRIPARNVPAAVIAATTPVSRATLATDGNSWAWYDHARNRVGWSDGRQVHQFSGTQLGVPPAGGGMPAVSGPYVFLYNVRTDAQSVLDARSGALAPLPDGSQIVAGGGGVAIGTATATQGPALLRLDTRSLPALVC